MRNLFHYSKRKGGEWWGLKNVHSLTSNWRTSADRDQIWKKRKGPHPPPPSIWSQLEPWLCWRGRGVPAFQGEKNPQGESYQRSGSHVCVRTQIYVNRWRWPGIVEHPLVLLMSETIDHSFFSYSSSGTLHCAPEMYCKWKLGRRDAEKNGKDPRNLSGLISCPNEQLIGQVEKKKRREDRLDGGCLDSEKGVKIKEGTLV